MPSICQGNWDCQNCPKAVSNAIAHIIYQRGFHRPAHKCEENFILFLMKGEMLVNSQEYAGTMLREGQCIRTSCSRLGRTKTNPIGRGSFFQTKWVCRPEKAPLELLRF